MARIAARQVSRVFFVPAGKNAGGLLCVYASKPSWRGNRIVRLPACRAAVTCLRPRPHTRPPRRANGNRMRRRTASANIRTAAAESSAVAVRTPEPARSGDPLRSGSVAALRTGKASGTYARRLSMVWTYRNDPRCRWLRSCRPQGIGTESVYAACLLYLFLATVSRFIPPLLLGRPCLPVHLHVQAPPVPERCERGIGRCRAAAGRAVLADTAVENAPASFNASISRCNSPACTLVRTNPFRALCYRFTASGTSPGKSKDIFDRLRRETPLRLRTAGNQPDESDGRFAPILGRDAPGSRGSGRRCAAGRCSTS